MAGVDGICLAGLRRAAARTALVVGTLAVAGCTQPGTPFYGTSAPTLVEVTAQNRALRALPPPDRRVTVAIYDFPDLTGQYKERETDSTLSRAVSQGGSAFLIKALQDAGERRWFAVLDRSGLQDIVRERQIITEMRRQYRGEEQIDPAALGPLKHAGIILRGGTIGYDTNIQTGGAGAAYLGIGGDTEWRMDSVTVSLSAVSTETGEALATVTARKTIGSSALRGSVFRYVALDELLEVETGVTANEPRSIALQQAVEKAVMALVIEGAELGLWSFADKRRGGELIARHRAEKFAGEVPASARSPVPPLTRNPSRIVQTQPRPRPQPARASVREIGPSGSGSEGSAPPPPPPPPEEEPEVLG